MEDVAKETLRIGIVGYGNLGKGAALAIQQNPDMELVAVFTRRSPNKFNIDSKVISISEITSFNEKIDVMILCGGSAKDLPEQAVMICESFNTVDSYDTRAKIPSYFEQVDRAAKSGGKLSLISTGWDPGLFSMARLLGQCVLPERAEYTFWGKGLSQGHSEAVRRVPGVKNGVQYTIPIESAIEKVRSGENPDLPTSEKHQRICYVVAHDGANLPGIEDTIKKMPHYFDEYQTLVHFITEEELKANHSDMPHGGIVLRSGVTGNGSKQRIEFGLALESNPEFTASVLV